MRIGTVIIYFLVSEVKRKSPCLEDFYVVEAEAHEKDNIIIDLVVGKVKEKKDYEYQQRFSEGFKKSDSLRSEMRHSACIAGSHRQRSH